MITAVFRSLIMLSLSTITSEVFAQNTGSLIDQKTRRLQSTKNKNGTERLNLTDSISDNGFRKGIFLYNVNT